MADSVKIMETVYLKTVEAGAVYQTVKVWTNVLKDLVEYLKKRNIPFVVNSTPILENQDNPSPFVPRHFNLVKIMYPATGIEELFTDFVGGYEFGQFQ
jgi:hypothetical protein